MAQEESATPKGRQTIFNLIGFLGFLVMIPLVLKSIGLGSFDELITKNLGMWGSASFLLIYFYAFPLLDLVFGSDRHLSPMLLGMLTAFLLFALVLPLPFMDWYRALFASFPFLKCSLAVLVLGNVAMLFGILLSYVKKGLPVTAQVFLIVVLPVAGLVAGIVLKADQVLKLPLFPL
jgi:hypothetical protein